MTTNDIKLKLWSILTSMVSKWQIKRSTWFDNIVSKLLKPKFHYKCKYEVCNYKIISINSFQFKRRTIFLLMLLIIKLLHLRQFLIQFHFQMMLQDLKNAVSQTFQKIILERHLLFTRWFRKQITSICENGPLDLLFDLDFPQFSEKIPCQRFHTVWNIVLFLIFFSFHATVFQLVWNLWHGIFSENWGKSRSTNKPKGLI